MNFELKTYYNNLSSYINHPNYNIIDLFNELEINNNNNNDNDNNNNNNNEDSQDEDNENEE